MVATKVDWKVEKKVVLMVGTTAERKVEKLVELKVA